MWQLLFAQSLVEYGSTAWSALPLWLQSVVQDVTDWASGLSQGAWLAIAVGVIVVVYLWTRR